MVAGITIKNVPPACTKQDLLKHFKSRRYGGGTIDYVLFPLVGDESQAFVTFRDSKVARSAATQRHSLHKQHLEVTLARKQMLTLCIVDVDPLVVENIPDVGAFVETLETDWGVRAVDDSDTGHMTIGGSLVQIQCVVSQLNSLLKPQPPKSPTSPLSATNSGIMGNRESPIAEPTTGTVERESAMPKSEVGTVVDPYIMDYAKKFFLDDIQVLEQRHHVTYEFDQQDEIALVYIIPVGGETRQTPQDIWKAKEQFCRFYHGVFKQVKTKTVRCGGSDVMSLQNPTELAVFETRNMFKCLYVIENPPGEIMLVGKPKCVALASDWLARKFSVCMPGDSSSTGNLNVLRMVLSLEEKCVLSVACCDTAKKLSSGKTVSIQDDLKSVAYRNSPEGNETAVTEDTENMGPDRGDGVPDGEDDRDKKDLGNGDDSSYDTFIRYDTGEVATPAGDPYNHMTSDESKEHKGTPYCHVPCYSALFGPSMFGHGSLVDAHTNFGHQPKEQEDVATTRADLETKLKAYNAFHEGKTLQIKSKEVNGRLVLEGPLRVNWGVQSAIQFKKKDDDSGGRASETLTPQHWRKSYKLAINNGLNDPDVEPLSPVSPTSSPVSISSSLSDLTQDTEHTGTSLRRYHTVALRRHRKPRRHDKRRLSMINGHIYDVDTSIFIPAHGSVTNVTISSIDTAPDVIRRLLAKFKVENSPEDFCLCKLMSTGETRMLQETDHPLMERVISGPLEDNAKIFIMDKDKVDVVTQEMAQFINLPDAMLDAFLQKYREEEEAAIREINNKYVRYRFIMQKALDKLTDGT